MKCILRIGYTDILLPDHKGVEKIIDMLSKGMKCSSRYQDGNYPAKVVRVEEEVELRFELLPPSTQFEVAPELQEKAEKIARIIKPKKVAGSQRTLLPLYEG